MPVEVGEAGGGLAPDEAFSILGNDTRVSILKALWDAFESGTGDNELAYSELFSRVDYDDSGNFSYHLEKLTGPFIRRTENGYELKQTGINVVRAVVAGTVIDDPEFGPTRIDFPCPRCDAPVEIEYADELLSASCTACAGLFRWDGDPGFIYIGLVPPAFIEERSVEAAFRAGIAHSFHEIAALHDGVCPHCAGTVERSFDVCPDHDPGPETLCPTCDRWHLTAVWLVCSTCKRSVFPPASALVLLHPSVTAFLHERGIDHRFHTIEALARVFDVGEELASEEPFRLRFTIPAGGDELELTLDEALDAVDVSR